MGGNVCFPSSCLISPCNLSHIFSACFLAFSLASSFENPSFLKSLNAVARKVSHFVRIITTGTEDTSAEYNLTNIVYHRLCYTHQKTSLLLLWPSVHDQLLEYRTWRNRQSGIEDCRTLQKHTRLHESVSGVLLLLHGQWQTSSCRWIPLRTQLQIQRSHERQSLGYSWRSAHSLFHVLLADDIQQHSESPAMSSLTSKHPSTTVESS